MIDHKKINELYESGMSYKKIASVLDYNYSTVTESIRMKRAGTQKLCSCCGKKGVANGNRFLCAECARIPEIKESSYFKVSRQRGGRS